MGIGEEWLVATFHFLIVAETHKSLGQQFVEKGKRILR